MDQIATQYGFEDARREGETKVEALRPPAQRFVITIPRRMAADFDICPTQVSGDFYAMGCRRRPLKR